MLHRKPTKDTRSNALPGNTTVPRRPSPMHPTLPTPKLSSTTSTTARETSRQLKQAVSPVVTASGQSLPQKPSALPRSTSGHSGPRLEALASSRPPPLYNPSRTTARHSRSGSEHVPLIFDSTMDQPGLTQSLGRSSPSSSQTMQTALSSLDRDHDTVLGIAFPQKATTDKQIPLPPQLIPELQALSSQQLRRKPLPPSSVSTISSPSTRLTESPAPWSASTTTTTPVSWPSTSPAVTHSSRTPEKRSRTVPEPTAPRSRLPKLPTIQHSTLQTRTTPPTKNDRDDSRLKDKRTKKRPIVESPAPTPPPRKSSAQRAASRGDTSGTGSIDDTLSRAGHFADPSLSDLDPSPLASRAGQSVEFIGDTLRTPNTDEVHESLQQSIRAPPSRPSREGTTDLGESRPAIVNEHRAGFSSQHRQLLASAFEDPMMSKAPVNNAFRSGSESSLPESGKPQRSPSRLGKLSRLGMFARRGTTPSSETEKSPNKLQRRGPAAGTGHERYGKYARRGRKTSTESSGPPSDSERSISSARRTPLIGSGRKNSVSSSRHNRSSQSDLDEFVATRLKPVIMRGGSQTSVPRGASDERDRARSKNSDQSSSRTSSVSPVPMDLRTGVRPRLRSPLQRISRPREETQVEAKHVQALALRRSLKFGPGREGFSIPMPIRTDDLVAPLQITSHDTSHSSMVPSSAGQSSSGIGAYRVDPGLLKTPKTKTKRPWWNPFKRRQQTVISPQPLDLPLRTQPEMAVSISAGPAPRSIPYYAVMESESDNNTTEHIGDFLSEAVRSPAQSPAYNPWLQPMQTESSGADRRTESILLPTAPAWTEQIPRSALEEDAEEPEHDLVKQPRLAQVGRIPKVVSRSERRYVPSRRSFSQPFTRKPAPSSLPQDDSKSADPLTERPQLEIHTDVLPSRPFPEAMSISAKPASAPAAAQQYQLSLGEPYLTQKSSKHGSEASASSSSEGTISVLGPPLIPTQHERDLMQRIPVVRVPSALHVDDEIWKEYDDFIDHVMSPSRSPKLRPRLSGYKQQAPATSLTAVENIPQRPTSRGKMPIPEPRRAVLHLPLHSSLTPPVNFPSPSLLSDKGIGDEIRLRRSRIVSALHSSIDPSSPFSMREFLKDYGAQARDSIGVSDRLSTSTAGQMPPMTPTSGRIVEDSSGVEHSQRENALLLDTVARSKDPARESELHYASLEVAKWLSFGRVLFSPAHEEIHHILERNVLVIDGLGSEDWSIYCAVTYEAEKAVVYDLKETSSDTLPQRDRSSQHLPANHRRAEIASLSERFPFHPAFFSAVVLRFPPAMAESKMRNIVAECRRVLVPGGHLEIMLLDLDIVNMGVQTRRAVRELKMGMAIADPEVSLKPSIDHFQTILGGGGFTGLNRCVVGVPVVGRPSGSMDSSSSSRSSRGSGGYGRQTPGDPTQNPLQGRGHNFSLNELVADYSDKADAKIGRMVSRTARSWWQHCFEASVIPDGDLSRSIFADKRVLQECKARASSFKLLIAYAQRPVFETRRRTMSEPGATNLATAGPPRRTKPTVE